MAKNTQQTPIVQAKASQLIAKAIATPQPDTEPPPWLRDEHGVEVGPISRARQPKGPAPPVSHPQRRANNRARAHDIMRLRAAGESRAAIATRYHVPPDRIDAWIQEAVHRGDLKPARGVALFSDPQEEMQFVVQAKAVRNLSGALDGETVTVGTKRKAVTKTMTATALEVAKGTVFKKFDPPKDHLPAMANVLAIKVEMPATGKVEARTDAMGGTPAYLDGEEA